MYTIIKIKSSKVDKQRLFSKKDAKCLVEYIFSKDKYSEAKKFNTQKIIELKIEKFAFTKKYDISKEQIESVKNSLLELSPQDKIFEIDYKMISNSKKVAMNFFVSIIPIALYWPLITDAIDKQIFELNAEITQMKDVIFCWLNNYFIHLPMFASISQLVDSMLLFAQKETDYLRISLKLDTFVEQKLVQMIDEKK